MNHNNQPPSEDENLIMIEDDLSPETVRNNQAPDRLLIEDKHLELIEEDLPSETTANSWKVIIVDDEPEVHESTKLLLKNFTFEDKPLSFFSAYSAAEAKALIAKNPDVALIFLDVVMEEDDAGLKLVEYIRNVLKNHSARIILRTGQPGQAPEATILINYDINDYQTKVELTYDKLVLTATAALRSYRDIINYPSPKTSKQISILVVDDNLINLELMTAILMRKKYNIGVATNGLAAIIAANKNNPDLILLDIMMPDMDGFEVFRELKAKERTKDIPIIWVSALEDISERVKALEFGGVDFIAKPVEAHEIIARIEVQLTNKKLKQQLEAKNKQLEEEIKTRLEVEKDLRLLERAISASSNGIVVTNALLPDNPIIYVNSGYEQITGYSKKEIIGKNDRFLHGEETDELELNKLREAIANSQEYQGLSRNYRKDGTTFWNELRISPVRDDRGNVTNFIGVSMDVTDRVEAEKALKASEERWELVLQGTGDGIFDWNVQTGKAFRSARLKEMQGFASDELPEGYEAWRALLHPEDLERVERAIVDYLEKRADQYAMEYRLRCKDGSYKWIFARGKAVWDEEGRPLRMVGSHQDISDRKAAEEALRRYELIVKATTDGICLVDGNYTYQLANEAYLNWHQKEKDKIVGRTVAEVLGEKMFAEIAKPKLDRSLAGETVQLEDWFEYPPGSRKREFMSITYSPYREENNQISGVAVSLRNLTELRKAEEALRESEARMRGVAANIPGAIHTQVLYAEGSWGFEYMSEGCRELFDVEPEMVLADAATVLEQIHPEDFPAYQQAINASLENLTPFSHEWRQLLPNGKDKWILGNSRPEPRENGDIVWHGVAMDASDRKAAEAALAEAAEAAEAANRAKSAFIANMSHELRTPLNGILGYVQIIEQERETTATTKKGINVIRQCGEHLLNLINDILDISKIEAEKLEIFPADVYFPSLLEGVADICRMKASDRDIELIYQALTPLPTAVRVDAKRLRQVLLNLLSNAIKFTDRGGVTFRVKATETPEAPSTVKLCFEIEDTGVGIPAEALERIFLAFEQVSSTKATREGTGLGLAISQRLVKLMGGEIMVESTLGVGSIFAFEIEVEKSFTAEIETVSVSTAKIVNYEGSRRQIMVADDRWENRSFLKNWLEATGFEIILAENGDDALGKLQNSQPDLIITDLLMPVINGWKFVEKLRELPDFKNTPVIASSASIHSQVFSTQIQDCNDFIPKPIDAEQLLRKIGYLLQLKWIYKTASQTKSPETEAREIVKPPSAELEALKNALSVGNFESLEAEAKRLQQLEDKYVPFATKILQLAENYQQEALGKLLR
ncbi:MAG: response regulator [Cyanobacteriota bacterium]|nr:response regulator [Cyanobacteriota bacterium]